MPNETAFLNAIVAEYDNDAPRLAYADWLAEQGSPKAEFIRVQCELADPFLPPRRRSELMMRERILRNRHPKELLVGITLRQNMQVDFRRGFPERLTIEMPRFLRAHKRILKALPTIRELKITSIKGGFRSFLEELETLSITQLDLSGVLGEDWGYSGVGNKHTNLINFARHRSIRKLTKLVLCKNELGNESARILADSDNLTHLQCLDLSHNRVSPAAVPWLIASETMTHLKTLKLSHSRLSETLGAAFQQVRASARLTELDLSHNTIRPIVLDSLSRAQALSKLTQLSLARCEITSRGVAPFLHASFAGQLQILDLSQNRIDSRILARPFSETSFPELRIVNLSQNEIEDDGAIAMAEQPGLTQLVLLDLTGNPIGSRGKTALKERFGALVLV